MRQRLGERESPSSNLFRACPTLICPEGGLTRMTKKSTIVAFEREQFPLK